MTGAVETLNAQLERADFILCASEEQRALYLGQLASLGRVNTLNYLRDDTLRSLLTVVPFGIESNAPEHKNKVLRGVREGFGPDDRILLLSGGLYDWFDPETLIRAVARLAQDHPNVRLFFQGTKHPHPGVPEMPVLRESRELASRLGVLGVNVFFNDAWVEYSERSNFLLEADAGVSTHFQHLETTFSFRTRILDYIWARLPMVVTDGDHFARVVREHGLGIVVPERDEEALREALARTLFDEQFREDVASRFDLVREHYMWPVVLEPLVEFVRDPKPAPDRAAGWARPHTRRRKKQYGFVHDARRTIHYLLHGGPRVVAEKVRLRLGRA